MGATAAATLAALVGREPRLVARRRSAEGHGRRGDRPVDGGRHGADRDVRSEALHAVRARREHQGRPEHVPDDSDRGRQHQVHAGARADRQRHGSRHGDPDVQRRGSRLHPALAASVSLAHRLHPAAADGDAAPRRGDLEDARAAESGRAGVHRDRADGRRAPARSRTLKAFHTAGLPRLRSRTVPDRRSAGRRVGRAAAEGARRGALPEPPRAVREAAGAGAGLSIRQRLSARVAREVARRRRSPAALAVGEGVRSVARAEEERSTPTTPAASGRAACWRGGSSKRARATSRSRRSTSRSSTGTPTRTATSAPTR